MNTTEYTTLRATGKIAEAVVNGVLRGGFVHNGTFYAHAGSRGIVKAAVSEVAGLRYFERGAQ